jgi:TonB family protein
MGRESDVKLRVTVEADGRVSHVELLSSGGEEFDREAEDALERARFVAARRGDEPVAAIVRFTVRFRLDE